MAITPGVRAAIVHDWFQGYHGSERVVEVLRRDVFGGSADVLTFTAARELLPPGLAAAIVAESRIARLPGIRQRGHDPGRWRLLLPYMPHYFGALDLGQYDVVVTSSHSCAVHARARPGAACVCYCYTPMRYAWMPDTDHERAGGAKGAALRAAGGWLRRADRAAAQKPDLYVAISTAVRERIREFYGRDAEVVHPPADLGDFDPAQEKEAGHFLWVHRLVSYKHPELVAEAFRGLPHRLTMVGIGPLEERLRANLPPNVELRSWLSREELAALYARASGFIHVGEEDFGLTMVEALAAGTPVIGLDRGGARDIVRPGQDGVLVDAPEVAQVRQAVAELAATQWDPVALAARAAEFSRERFVERMHACIATAQTLHDD
jgi:glycosyltransferase involved in cell wall biosynthesis